jgi:hypothetical protein
MSIWYILRPFAIFSGHLVYFLVIWYILSHFGMLQQEKSGSPGWHAEKFRNDFFPSPALEQKARVLLLKFDIQISPPLLTSRPDKVVIWPS